MKKLSSVIDYVRIGLPKEIWDVTEDSVELQPEIEDEILDIAQSFLDDLDLPQEALKDILIYGSILTNQYNKKTDIDARFLLDEKITHEKYPGVMGDELYEWSQGTIKGILLGDTQHPFNATVVIEGDDTELGRAELGKTKREPVYSVLQDAFIVEPYIEESDFDPDEKFNLYLEEVKKIMEDIDEDKRNLSMAITDYETIEDALGDVEYEDKFLEKLKESEEEIKESIISLVDQYTELKTDRKKKYDSEEGPHLGEGNIKYKLLEKYNYLSDLKELKKMIEEGIEKEDLDEVRKLVEARRRLIHEC